MRERKPMLGIKRALSKTEAGGFISPVEKNRSYATKGKFRKAYEEIPRLGFLFLFWAWLFRNNFCRTWWGRMEKKKHGANHRFAYSLVHTGIDIQTRGFLVRVI